MTSISDRSHLLWECLKTVAYVQFTLGLIQSTGKIELRCTGNEPSRRNVVLLEEFQETWYTYFSSVHSLCMAFIVSKPDRGTSKPTHSRNVERRVFTAIRAKPTYPSSYHLYPKLKIRHTIRRQRRRPHQTQSEPCGACPSTIR